MQYGKVDNRGQIVLAPPTLKDGDTYVLTPTEQDYFNHEYKRLHLDSPSEPAPIGEHWERNGIEETEHDICYKWESVPDPIMYRAWTPLTIMRGAKNEGLWESLKTTLEQNAALEEFMACQYVAECDPSFVGIRAVIVSQIGEEKTREFVDALKVEKIGTQEDLVMLGE